MYDKEPKQTCPSCSLFALQEHLHTAKDTLHHHTAQAAESVRQTAEQAQTTLSETAHLAAQKVAAAGATVAGAAKSASDMFQDSAEAVGEKVCKHSHA